MISYTIQCGLSIASIAALVPLVFLQPKMYASFGALTHSYTLANWWFSMAVFVSAAVLYAQDPLFSERMILKSLFQLQVYPLGISGTMWIVCSWYKDGVPIPKGTWRKVLLGKDFFTCVFRIGVPLSIGIVCSLLVESHRDGLEEVAMKIEHDNLVINEHTDPCISYLIENSQGSNLAIFNSSPERMTYGISSAVSFVLLSFSIYKKCRFIACYSFSYFVPWLSALASWQIVHLVRVFHQRKQIRAIADNDYADNDWGYGQLLSMFTWVPILFQGGLWIYKAIIHRGGK